MQAQLRVLPAQAQGEPRVTGGVWGLAVPGSAVPPPGMAVSRFHCVPVCLYPFPVRLCPAWAVTWPSSGVPRSSPFQFSQSRLSHAPVQPIPSRFSLFRLSRVPVQPLKSRFSLFRLSCDLVEPIPSRLNHVPVHPIPAHSGSFCPGSSRPLSFRPSSSCPGSSCCVPSHPMQSIPSHPGSSRPGSSHPGPSCSGSSHPAPVHPAPSRSILSRFVLSRPGSSRPGLSRPGLSHPVPLRPIPVRPVPIHPVPVRPVPPRLTRSAPSRPGPRVRSGRRSAAQWRHLPAPPRSTAPGASRRRRDLIPSRLEGRGGDPIPAGTPPRTGGTMTPLEGHGEPGSGPAQPTGHRASAGGAWSSPGMCGGR